MPSEEFFSGGQGYRACTCRGTSEYRCSPASSAFSYFALQDSTASLLPDTMRNVEIKVRLSEEQVKGVEAVCLTLCGKEPTILKQVDTFFTSANGRLKLRQLDSHAELIYYERPDQAGPKLSTFSIHRVQLADVDNLCSMLTAAMGARGMVRKTRRLWLVGQTRVHLDHVADLGWFMELEVVLMDEQTMEEGQQIAEALMCKMGIDSAQLLSEAYIDLLQRQQNQT